MAYILIADDDPDFAEAVALALESEGHETAIELELARVEPRLNERLPDCLVLDVMFPENPCGGFEAARAIVRTHKDLPILMLTAINQQFPLGFSGKDIDPTWLPVAKFLEKPIDFRVLKETVRELLAPRA